MIKISLDVITLNAEQINYKTIELNWKKAIHADNYYIYQFQNNAWILKGETSETTYSISKLKTGVEYMFAVSAVKKKDDGTCLEGTRSASVRVKTMLEGEPELTIKSKGTTRFDLTWTRVDGATRYIIYRKSTTAGWKKILTLGGNVYTYTTSSMIPDTYTYLVKAARYDSVDRVQTNGSNTCVVTSYYKQPVVQIKKLNSSSVSIHWDEIEGIKYYEVYRKTSKQVNYKKMKTTTATSYQNQPLTQGKIYYYRIRGYRTYQGQKIYTQYSSVKSIKM